MGVEANCQETYFVSYSFFAVYSSIFGKLEFSLAFIDTDTHSYFARISLNKFFMGISSRPRLSHSYHL